MATETNTNLTNTNMGTNTPPVQPQAGTAQSNSTAPTLPSTEVQAKAQEAAAAPPDEGSAGKCPKCKNPLGPKEEHPLFAGTAFCDICGQRFKVK